MKGLYAYFAYGSNLLPERLFQRCPTAVPYAPAILPNYALSFVEYLEQRFTASFIFFGRRMSRVLTATRDIRRFTSVTPWM